MADFKQENEALKERISLLEKLNGLSRARAGTEEDLLDTIRDNNNLIQDYSKQLSFQVSEKQRLKQISNDLNKISENSFTILQKELGTSKATQKLSQDKEKINKNILGLQSLLNKIVLEDKELQREINTEIKNQIISSQKLADSLETIEETSSAVKNNLGVKTFSGIKDIANAIPGLRKFSGPFEQAAEAARSHASEQISQIAAGNKNLDLYKKLRQEGMSMNDALKKAGVSAKQVKVGKLPLKAQGAFKAGFKALGPIISKALGPLALVKMAVDAIKFFVSAMFAANKEAVGLSRNLSASVKEGAALRNFYKDQKNLLETQYKLTSELVNAQGELSQLSALSNVYSVDALDAQLQMTKELGLSVDEASHLNKMFMKNKKSSTENLDIAFDTVAEYANQNGMLFNTTKILGKASKVSGQLLASFKGSTKELIKAVIQTERLGINLEDAKNISSNLLDFESSISNELEAELLTGKDLNLERARSLALQGDFAGAAAEALKNVDDLKEFQEMTVIQQNALAKAAGLTVDQLSDALMTQKFQGTETGKQIARLKEAGMVEQANALAAGKLTGEQLQTSLKQLDAQQKFNLTVARAKEIFSDLVDGGALQTLADALQGLADSSLLKGYAEKGEAKRIAQKTQESTTATQAQKDITKDAAEKVAQATTADDITDVAGAALAGAAIGSIIPGIGTALGAGLGAVGALIKNKFDQNAAEKAFEKSKIISKELSNPETADDFIIRPGQKPLKFRKDDVVIGGTNLGGNNQEVVTLLRELVTAVNSGGNVYLDSTKVGTAMAVGTYKVQ